MSIASLSSNAASAALTLTRQKAMGTETPETAKAAQTTESYNHPGASALGKGKPIDQATKDRLAYAAQQMDSVYQARIDGAERTAGIIEKKLELIGWLNQTIANLPDGTSVEERASWMAELSSQQSDTGALSQELDAVKEVLDQRQKFRAEFAKYGVDWDKPESASAYNKVV